MHNELILMPMGALALLTFLVLFYIPLRRLRAGPGGTTEVDTTPEALPATQQNHMSLLEMPILFYVICLMLFVTNRADLSFLWLAWIYVGLRALHSFVHLTYNHPFHRTTLFALSNFALIAMWVFFFLPPMGF